MFLISKMNWGFEVEISNESIFNTSPSLNGSLEPDLANAKSIYSEWVKCTHTIWIKLCYLFSPQNWYWINKCR